MCDELHFAAGHCLPLRSLLVHKAVAATSEQQVRLGALHA